MGRIHFRAGRSARSRFLRAVGRPVRRICGAFPFVRQNGFRAVMGRARTVLSRAARGRPRLFRRAAVAACLLALALTAGALAPVWANFTFAKRVEYAHTVLGTVRDADTLASAKIRFVRAVMSDAAESYLEDCALKTVYTEKSRLLTARGLAETMLENTDSLCYGYGLFVDGEAAAVCGDDGVVYDCLANRLAAYRQSTGASHASFAEDVDVRGGYYPECSCLSADAFRARFESGEISLSVKTSVIRTREETVDFAETETETEELAAGIRRVAAEGEPGKNRVTERVTYLDGVEVAAETVRTEQIRPPQTREILVGTYRPAGPAGGGLLWPLPVGTAYRLTGPYQESRTGHTHAGVDLACGAGTPVLAAADGTVTEAGSDRSYGLYVVICHGNNLSTLYAHCASLNVAAGDTARRGEPIGTVGRTGNATGFHLHFEVRSGGENADPFRFIGG